MLFIWTISANETSSDALAERKVERVGKRTGKEARQTTSCIGGKEKRQLFDWNVMLTAEYEQRGMYRDAQAGQDGV